MADCNKEASNIYFFQSGSGVSQAVSLAATATNLAAEMTGKGGVAVTAAAEVIVISASNAGTAGNSITFTSGSATTTLVEGANAVGGRTLAALLPSRGGSDGTADLEGSTIVGTWASASLTLSGSNWGAKSLTSYTYKISFDTGSSYTGYSYIEDVFSKDAQVQKSGQNTVSAYLYKNFKYAQSSQGYGATAEVTASA